MQTNDDWNQIFWLIESNKFFLLAIFRKSK